MDGFPLFMALTTVMGLSIFLSLPIVYSRRAQGRWAVALNAGAIGILLFLLADIFSDVSPVIYPSGYVADPRHALLFVVAFLVAYLGLFAVDQSPRSLGFPADGGARTTAFIVALGIGLQNLTEGLVFGVNWVGGTVGILAVVFVGFFLQNVTEGFPIAAPFLGSTERRGGSTLVTLFLLGGLPTLLGGALGFYWHSTDFELVFDSLAIGAIGYVLLPMLRTAFRPLDSREASGRRYRLVSVGVMIGFLVGFAVNAI